MNIISENQFNVLQDIISKTDAKFNERLEQINNTNSMKEIAEICRLQIDGELLNYIKSNFKNIKLTESFMGVRFEYIYSKKPKFLYNGSDPRTKDRLYNAIKYQYISQYNYINEHRGLLCIIAYKLLRKVNNSITYNEGKTIYDPINQNCIKRMLIAIKEEINNKNYDVYDVNGYVHKLKIDYEFKRMKRFTKNELTDIIKQVGETPTLQEICDYINEQEMKKEWPNTVYTQQLKYYVNEFELQDLVKQRKRRTKAELQK